MNSEGRTLHQLQAQRRNQKLNLLGYLFAAALFAAGFIAGALIF